MNNLTPYQELAAIQKMTGVAVKLQQFETLQACMVTDSMVIILINTYKFRSSKGTYTIIARGLKRVTIDRTAGSWGIPTVAVIWADDYVPHEIRSFVSDTSPEERRAWEELCYRPGTASDPRDSYAREQQGYNKVSEEVDILQRKEEKKV